MIFWAEGAFSINTTALLQGKDAFNVFFSIWKIF